MINLLSIDEEEECIWEFKFSTWSNKQAIIKKKCTLKITNININHK